MLKNFIKLQKIGIYLLIALLLGFVAILLFDVYYYLGLLLKSSENALPSKDLPAFTTYAYGRWAAVLMGIGIFSFFVISFLVPTEKREWRSLGVYEAFIIALFTEMFGFPLTIYILTSFFGIPLSLGHMQGHLLATALSMLGIIDLAGAWLVVMVVSLALILAGFILISSGWSHIYRSKGELVTDGIYRYTRHPQYLGLMLITLGLLVQWPTIITLAMWPILILMYYRLAKREELEMEAKFGGAYIEYKRRVSMFFPASLRLVGGI